jgi:hypothetical protein
MLIDGGAKLVFRNNGRMEIRTRTQVDTLSDHPIFSRRKSVPGQGDARLWLAPALAACHLSFQGMASRPPHAGPVVGRVRP